jgi:hypothetical protein
VLILSVWGGVIFGGLIFGQSGGGGGLIFAQSGGLIFGQSGAGGGLIFAQSGGLIFGQSGGGVDDVAAEMHAEGVGALAWYDDHILILLHGTTQTRLFLLANTP